MNQYDVKRFLARELLKHRLRRVVRAIREMAIGAGVVLIIICFGVTVGYGFSRIVP